MPELPEVETMCRGIVSIVGRQITKVSQPPCSYRPIAISPNPKQIDRRLRGDVVTGVRRLGKRVLVQTRADWVLVLQPKMTGLVLIGDPPNPEHLRLRVHFADTGLLLQFWDRRGLGTVELIQAAEIESRIVAGRLGPDALDIPLGEFKSRLRKTRRPIKVALLDQKLLAGVGNLYASEMLHAARIHPARLSSELQPAKLNSLYSVMRDILETAIQYEGSTLGDGTYRNALNSPGEYQNHHLVYDRAGMLCVSCGKGEIQRIVQAQRSTFFCPVCQRK